MSCCFMKLPLKVLPLLSHLGGSPPVAPVLVELEEDEEPWHRTLAVGSPCPKSPKWPGWFTHVSVDSFPKGFIIIASSSHPAALPTVPLLSCVFCCSSAFCFGSCFPSSCCLLALFSLVSWISLGSLTPKKNHLRTQPSSYSRGPFYPVLVPRQKGAVPILADHKLAMVFPLS